MNEANKVRKCWHTTSEAIEYILAPGSDSELSDLESDSDDDSDFTFEKNVVDAERERQREREQFREHWHRKYWIKIRLNRRKTKKWHDFIKQC